MKIFSPYQAHGLQSVGFRIAAFAALCFACANAHAARPLVELVPADAIACITTPDLVQLDKHWQAAGFYRLWQAEQLQGFRSAFRTATRLAPNGNAPLTGITWQQLLAVASGEACWALLPVGKENTGFLLLVDISGHEDEAKKLANELGEQTASRHYFVASGVLGVSNREELAQQAREQLAKKQVDSLAVSSAYQAITDRCGDDPVDLTWYVDPWAFQALSRRAGSESVSKTWKQLADEGFTVIEAAGGCMRFSTQEFDLQHRWFIYAQGVRKRAARMLDFAPHGEWKTPEWAPTDVDSLLSLQWNLGGALAGYGALFDTAFAEGVEGTFEAVLEDIKVEEGGPQVDLLALMKLQAGPVLILSKTLADSSTATAYAVKVKDEAKTADALKRMLEPDRAVRQKKVGEHVMWVFQESDPNDGPAMGPDLSGYAFAAALDHLFVANAAEVLETILKQAGPALVNDPKYNGLLNQAKARVGKEVIGWRVAPSAAGLRPLYERLRAGGAVDMGQLLGDDPTDEHQLDLAKLPGGEFLHKFISSGFGVIKQMKDGWLTEGYVQKGAE